MPNIHEFKQVMRNAGLEPPDYIEPEKFHRFPGAGKSSGNTSGWCVLFPSGSGGTYGDWSTGLQDDWFAKQSYTSEERTVLKREIANYRMHAQRERERDQANAALKAKEIWKNSEEATNHPYLKNKGIKPHSARLSSGSLIIPIWINGSIASLQFISESGDKRFLSGGQKSGGYFTIGKPDKVICITEGFATGASIYEATGYAVAIAFDCGNLKSVALAIREKHPDKKIIICADDDYLTENNPGRTKGNEAALAVNGTLALPVFSKRPDGATDFNDLHKAEGLESVKRVIDSVDGYWDDPEPIAEDLPPIEEFHIELLPQPLRDWVADICDRMQCPVEFVAVSAMVSLSSVIGLKAGIHPKQRDDWMVMPNLWGMLVGAPSTMKSPSLKEALKPLDRLVAAAKEEFDSAVINDAIKAQISELQKKKTQKDAEKAIGKGDSATAQALLSQLAEDAPTAILRRYIVNDSSVESLGEILIENPNGVLAYRDEFNGLLRNLDKEGNEGARAFYLQAYNGNQSYTFDRIGRGKNLYIPSVCLSLLGGIQPGLIQSYVNDTVVGGKADDGLLQRFGLMVYPNLSREYKHVDRYPNNDAKNQAFDLFERLDNLVDPVAYRFDPKAQVLYDKWHVDHMSRMRKGELHPAIESHLMKYTKLVPAISLICALCNQEQAVSELSIMTALAWAKLLESHAMRIYSMGMNTDSRGAKEIIDRIRNGQIKDGFKAADIYQKGWSSLTTEQTQKAIEFLIDRNYLMAIEKPKGLRGGRPSTTYLINPKIYEEINK